MPAQAVLHAQLMAPAAVAAGLAFKHREARRRLYHVLRPLLKDVVTPYGLRVVARGESRWGVVHHVGRRSGVVHHPPIEPQFTRDGVLIPLAFGPGADWCRNILAADGCTLTFKGDEFVLKEPRVVSIGVAEPQLSADRARASRRVGVEQFLSLKIASPIDRDTSPRVSLAESAV